MPKGIYDRNKARRRPARKRAVARKAAHANPALMQTVASKRVVAAVRLAPMVVHQVRQPSLQMNGEVRTLNFAVRLAPLNVSIDVPTGVSMNEAQIKEQIVAQIMTRAELPELQYTLVDIR